MDRGVAAAWAASHVIPDGGLSAWDAPDPTRPPAAEVDAGLEVRALETRGDWTRVAFTNGWEAWVDGRRLAPVPGPSFTIPPGGLPAWAAPDPTQAPVSQAEAGLDVRVLETTGDWARVRFSNGWSAWVDRRALVPAGRSSADLLRSAARAPRAITPLPGVGAALILLGSFLPWVGALGVSVSAWEIPAWGLLTRQATTISLRTGVVLLVPLLACLPYLTRRPLPGLVIPVLASIGTSFALAALVLASSLPGASVGIGAVITFVGGLVMACDFLVPAKARA